MERDDLRYNKHRERKHHLVTLSAPDDGERSVVMPSWGWGVSARRRSLRIASSQSQIRSVFSSIYTTETPVIGCVANFLNGFTSWNFISSMNVYKFVITSICKLQL